MRPLKATFEQLRRHNRRLVLRALYAEAAESRAELASVTGLTKPTISNLIAELLDEGLVSEQGPGRSTESGGKRPTLLRFEPDARQVIGVTVSGSKVLGVLSNLGGRSAAVHLRELAPGEAATDDHGAALRDVIVGLLPQLDAPLLCLGLGLPGGVEGGGGRSHGATEIGELLTQAFGVPVHLGNRAELSALGQLAFADGVDQRATLVTLMVDDTVEIGVCLGGGSIHYGSDLSQLTMDGRALASALSWSTVAERARALGESKGSAAMANAEMSYLRLRAARLRGDPAAAALWDELATGLAPLLSWLVATLRPAQVSFGGPISDLGEDFLHTVRERAGRWLPSGQLSDVRLDLAYAEQLGAMGAVALAIQEELELLSG